MQRRRLLKLGVVSASAISIVGGGVLLLQEPAWRGKQFKASATTVLTVVSAGLLDGSLPDDENARASAMASLLDRLTATVAGLPVSSQRELGRLLAILALAPGRLALSGLASDWSRASRHDVQAALETMRASRFALRRQVYHALRDLARAAWYADKGTWPALGYPGPQTVA